MSKPSSPAPSPETVPAQFDIDQFLPQLIDHFMATWNRLLERELPSVGLTFPQWRVLLITSHRGPMNIRQLSDATLVPHSTLARWVRHMEKAGLVGSKVFDGDKRAVELSITAKGRRSFAKAFPIAERVYNDALVGFSDAERRTLLDFMHRLRRNIGME